MEESWLSARSRCSKFSNEERRERGSWSVEFPANQNLEVDGNGDHCCHGWHGRFNKTGKSLNGALPSFADGMLIPLSLQQPLWGVIIDHNQLVKDTLVSVINGNQVAIQPVYCSENLQIWLIWSIYQPIWMVISYSSSLQQPVRSLIIDIIDARHHWKTSS